MNSTTTTIPTYTGYIVDRIKFYEDGSILIAIPPELAEEFRNLVQRGSNLNPDSSPAIKELADVITNGKVMQDYFSQSNVKREVNGQ